jgi:hypothetical protein
MLNETFYIMNIKWKLFALYISITCNELLFLFSIAVERSIWEHRQNKQRFLNCIIFFFSETKGSWSNLKTNVENGTCPFITFLNWNNFCYNTKGIKFTLRGKRMCILESTFLLLVYAALLIKSSQSFIWVNSNTLWAVKTCCILQFLITKSGLSFYLRVWKTTFIRFYFRTRCLQWCNFF